eukprot:scaffold6776_cov37-Cyclotella_meneghiniana.AAC.3
MWSKHSGLAAYRLQFCADAMRINSGIGQPREDSFIDYLHCQWCKVSESMCVGCTKIGICIPTITSGIDIIAGQCDLIAL